MNVEHLNLPELVAALYPELSDQRDVAWGRTWMLVEWRGRVIGIRRQTRDLLGPFASAYQVVTELGERVPPEKEGEPDELWLWDGRRFTVDHERHAVEAFDTGGAKPLSRRSMRALGGKLFVAARPAGRRG